MRKEPQIRAPWWWVEGTWSQSSKEVQEILDSRGIKLSAADLSEWAETLANEVAAAND